MYYPSFSSFLYAQNGESVQERGREWRNAGRVLGQKNEGPHNNKTTKAAPLREIWRQKGEMVVRMRAGLPLSPRPALISVQVYHHPGTAHNVEHLASLSPLLCTRASFPSIPCWKLLVQISRVTRWSQIIPVTRITRMKTYHMWHASSGHKNKKMH